MFSKRYHLFTLTAVFLALGTGILLGGTHGGEWLKKQQQVLIQRLEVRYMEALKENRLLLGRVKEREREMKSRNQEHRRMFQTALHDELKGQVVLLVGGNGEERERLSRAIRWAGGIPDYGQKGSNPVLYDRYDAVVCLQPRIRRYQSVLHRDIRLAYSGPLILQSRFHSRTAFQEEEPFIYTFHGSVRREDSLEAYQAVKLIRHALNRRNEGWMDGKRADHLGDHSGL
ncbi:copper transporter [Salinithrix halophila]|uniref:Copper transporter n=1 Tax=Salinithrix halophila TaxID=1485204 RepID=A0ABV8JMJ9_9BACL